MNAYVSLQEHNEVVCWEKNGFPRDSIYRVSGDFISVLQDFIREPIPNYKCIMSPTAKAL